MATFMDFGYFTTVISRVEVFGENWIVMVAFTLLICLILTSKPHEMSILFLPVFLSLKIIGFDVTYAVYVGILVLAGILFLVNALSYSILTSAVKSFGTGIGDIMKGKSWTGKREIDDFRQTQRVSHDLNKYREDLIIDKLMKKKHLDSDKDFSPTILPSGSPYDLPGITIGENKNIYSKRPMKHIFTPPITISKKSKRRTPYEIFIDKEYSNY